MWGRCRRPPRWRCRRPVHPHACGADESDRSQTGQAWSVHPHACGADAPGIAFLAGALHGSSPRVWGRLSPRARTAFISSVHPHACGADGRGGCRRGADRPVHPHACGADFPPPRAPPKAIYGSSPRVWGRFFQVHGVTSCFYGSSPRVWGRFSVGMIAPRSLVGSSPRVWGRYFPKCSYDWILINCNPSKSMIDRRGFPYVSMVKPCSLLVE